MAPEAQLDLTGAYQSSKLEICTYEDPVLRRKSVPVSDISDAVRQFAEKMKVAMALDSGIKLVKAQLSHA